MFNLFVEGLGFRSSLLIIESLFLQREFEEICNHFKTHEHARLILKYDESLSHLIYAAADMFIIPSIFEPCGLTQVLFNCFSCKLAILSFSGTFKCFSTQS